MERKIIKMGMFDNVKCEYKLPDCPRAIQKEIFQTKSFGDDFVGGFLEDYTITEKGKLIYNKKIYEYVKEEDRPYYGKPEWDDNPLFRVAGSMKSVPLKDEESNYSGIINIYTIANDDVWYEYEIKFIDGEVSDIKRIYREFGK
jgi:hypothetical protein